MDLRITREHARKGKRNNSTSCPTALALLDVGFDFVYVNGRVCYVDSFRRSARLSEKLGKAIDDFDRGEPFRVGTYRIPGLKRPKKGDKR